MREFTCVECGRRIFSFGYDPPDRPNTCAACLSMPGWHRDPELRRRLDPDYEAGTVDDPDAADELAS